MFCRNFLSLKISVDRENLMECWRVSCDRLMEEAIHHSTILDNNVVV